jgi:ribokinase
MDNYPLEGSKNVSKEKISCTGGSASIIAFALAKWNMQSYISGVVGYDEMGNAIRKDMETNRVNTSFLETNYDIKTPTSYIISNNQNKSQTIITSEVSNFNIKKYEYDQDISCVIADGREYNASVYAFNKYSNGVTILNAKNPKPGLLDFFKYAKYVICSDAVAEAMTGLKIDFNNPITLSNIYKKIMDKYPNINLLIKVEDKGTIYQINGEIKFLADIKSDGVDKTGAYDVFVACIGYGLTSKYDMETTIRLATIASSLSKNIVGSTLSIPLLSDVVSFYESKFGPIVKPNATLEENEINASATN